jgi:hypothetical protein
LRQRRAFASGPWMHSKCEVEENQEGEGNLTAKPSEFRVSCLRVKAVECGNPSVNPLFIGRKRPLISRAARRFTFLPRRSPLTTVKFPSGRARLLPWRASAWAVRGSSEARFSPCAGLVVSSTHLQGRTTLTDEGLLLGKMVFGSVMPRPARRLASVHMRLRFV